MLPYLFAVVEFRKSLGKNRIFSLALVVITFAFSSWTTNFPFIIFMLLKIGLVSFWANLLFSLPCSTTSTLHSLFFFESSKRLETSSFEERCLHSGGEALWAVFGHVLGQLSVEVFTSREHSFPFSIKCFQLLLGKDGINCFKIKLSWYL